MPLLFGQGKQLYAHCDMVKVWHSLPEAARIEEELALLRKEYQEDLGAMIKEYRQRQEQGQENWRTWSTGKRDSSLRSLRRMEERILRYRDKMERSVLEKEATLLAPLREQIRRSIAVVAERKGLAYVFDSSSPQLFSAEGNGDITQAVIAQLGIKNRKTLRP